MRPRRFKQADVVFTLPGGNEDNDLFAEAVVQEEDGTPGFLSQWELSPEEVEAVSRGRRIALIVWGTAHPPVSMSLAEPE